MTAALRITTSLLLAIALAVPAGIANASLSTEDALAKTSSKSVKAIKIKARTLSVGSESSIKIPTSSAKKVKWSSTNRKIATVSAKGVVRAKKTGRCTIKAKTGKSVYVCSVSVVKKKPSIASGTLRDTAFSLVSSAENSTLDYRSTYSYIEDIGDGRGYTCGIIGFTSATGDLLSVVKKYVKLKPSKNVLARYLPALKAVNGAASKKGLGSSFVQAWKKACKTPEMIKAQNSVLRNQYLDPAIKVAKTDGLSPLGQFVYYDAMVVHGPGSDAASFGGIRKAALKKSKTPSKGGNEASFLKAFLSARTKIMRQEEAHSDLSRINAQRKFISEGNFALARPLTWTMYGDRFTLK